MGNPKRKGTLEDHLSLNVEYLRRRQCLKSGLSYLLSWSETDSIKIQVTHEALILKYRERARGEAWQQRHYPVTLSWVPCRYGGHRPYFHCPKCHRRVVRLLSRWGLFTCRQCAHVNYFSQQENKASRPISQAQKLRQRIDASSALVDPIEMKQKPKGMHWQTFYRHLNKINQAEGLALLIMGSRLLNYSKILNMKKNSI